MPKSISLLMTTLGLSLLIGVGIVLVVTKLNNETISKMPSKLKDIKLLGNDSIVPAFTVAGSIVVQQLTNTASRNETGTTTIPRLSQNASSYKGAFLKPTAFLIPNQLTLQLTPFEAQAHAPQSFTLTTGQIAVTGDSAQSQTNLKSKVDKPKNETVALKQLEKTSYIVGVAKHKNKSYFISTLLSRLATETPASIKTKLNLSTVSSHKPSSKTTAGRSTLIHSPEITTTTMPSAKSITQISNQPKKVPSMNCSEFNLTLPNATQSSAAEQSYTTVAFFTDVLPTTIPYTTNPSPKISSLKHLLISLTSDGSPFSKTFSYTAATLPPSVSEKSSTETIFQPQTLSLTNILPTPAKRVGVSAEDARISPKTGRVRGLLTFEQACRKMEKRFGICNFNTRTRRYRWKCGRLHTTMRGKRLCFQCRRTRQCRNTAKGFQ